MPARLSLRWTVAIAALLVVVAAGAGAAWWFLWVPSTRPALRSDEFYGIDVSNHQGHIDWQPVAGDNIDFAYIKATEGATFTDRSFATNWRSAGRAGVLRGAYHFFTLCRSGRKQAEHFLQVAPPDASALSPAADFELAGNCRDRPAPAVVDARVDAFLRRVERAWKRPVLLYVGGDWAAHYQRPGRPDSPRWVVRRRGRPDVEWTVWQQQRLARVDGVSGRVDLDVGRLAGLSGPRLIVTD